MNAIKSCFISGALAFAAATPGTFAADIISDSPAGADGFQNAGQFCADCNRSQMEATPPAGTNAATQAKTATPAKPRHTLIAFGFVLRGKSPALVSRDREAAAFNRLSEVGTEGRIWDGNGAYRKPEGLRLFSWSW